MKRFFLLIFCSLLILSTAKAQKIPLKFEHDVHHFGIVEKRIPLFHNFEFQNVSNDTLFLSIQDTCACSSNSYSYYKASLIVLPNEKGIITVVWNLKKEKIAEEMIKSIKIIDDSPKDLAPIYLTTKAILDINEPFLMDSVKTVFGDKPRLDENGYPDPNKFIPAQKRPEPTNMDSIKIAIGYPQEAINLGIKGDVILKILVDEEGNYVKHVVLRQIHPSLLSAVEKQVSKLHFTPAIQDEKPIKFWVATSFKFLLGGTSVEKRKPPQIIVNCQID